MEIKILDMIQNLHTTVGDHFFIGITKLGDAGILPEHLSVTDLCTACHPDLLWSHRKTNGQRGGLSAFLSLIDTSV